MFFAFTQESFEKGMKKLGLNPLEVDKIYKIGYTGGFYKREDSKMLYKMFERHSKELQKAIKNDKTRDGFIFQMFNYELAKINSRNIKKNKYI